MSQTKHMASTEAYYDAMGRKDLSGMAQYLHPDVQFLGLLANITGKETVLKGAEGLLLFVKGLTIRAKFGSGNQTMLAYDLECHPPVGTLRVAALMTFEEDLIVRIEIFFDARPFETK
ncbi:MAG: hypothetical protein K0R76_401 [Alphaproteobacteria bacterium]|nr:hypothetical protein [Alphaproteobacteria bacterium]